jgi:acetylornithine/N-succinyldiaminopimelate aminotransferase
VVSEVRGEGLLIGLKAVVPAGDLITTLRDEKLLAVGAGENVIRLLPPLIINESEISEGVSRIERACAALSQQGEQRKAAP